MYYSCSLYSQMLHHSYSKVLVKRPLCMVFHSSSFQNGHTDHMRSFAVLKRSFTDHMRSFAVLKRSHIDHMRPYRVLKSSYTDHMRSFSVLKRSYTDHKRSLAVQQLISQPSTTNLPHCVTPQRQWRDPASLNHAAFSLRRFCSSVTFHSTPPTTSTISSTSTTSPSTSTFPTTSFTSSPSSPSTPSAMTWHTTSVPLIRIENLSDHHFSEIIDVRTPPEFREDSIPGATNLPVLTEEERVEVGTLYHRDALLGRKLGAALISGNISSHIIQHFNSKARGYQPLIYCWRGGQRSRAMALVLQEIGFQPRLLQGGYKSYRKHVAGYFASRLRQPVHPLQPGTTRCLDQLQLVRVSGATGSGKTRLLTSLAATAGQQVLDLEHLARHKGSILGEYPGEGQPSQKLFETRLLHTIQQLRSDSVVFVENESNRIGRVSIPPRLWEMMLDSPRIHITVPLEERINFLLQDYDYLLRDPARLTGLLGKLEKHGGRKAYLRWIQQLETKDYRGLTESLIQYYDSSYKKPKGQPLRTLQVPPGFFTTTGECSGDQDDDSVVKDFLTELIDCANSHFQKNLTEKVKTPSLESI